MGVCMCVRRYRITRLRSRIARSSWKWRKRRWCYRQNCRTHTRHEVARETFTTTRASSKNWTRMFSRFTDYQSVISKSSISLLSVISQSINQSISRSFNLQFNLWVAQGQEYVESEACSSWTLVFHVVSDLKKKFF